MISKDVDKRYKDAEFHPFNNKIEDDLSVFNDVEWVRIDDYYHSPFIGKESSLNMIKQGYFGDCHLISSLSAISLSNDHINMLFDQPNDLNTGKISVIFNFLGKRTKVIVDTLIPLKNGKTLLCRPKHHKDMEKMSFWFVMVEKAYAKLYGGFISIFGGKSDAVFFRLVGGWPFAFFFDDPETKALLKNGKMWERMRRWSKKGYFMCAGSINGPNNEMNENGIHFGHSYSVLKVAKIDGNKLIFLRNTWGKSEWRGRFGVSSDEWTKKLRKKLHYRGKNDGNFWMCFRDFKKNFLSLYVDILLNEKWKKCSIFGHFPDGIIKREFQENNENQWLFQVSQPSSVKFTFEKVGKQTVCFIVMMENCSKKIVSIPEESSCFFQSIPKSFEVMSFEWFVDVANIPLTLAICDGGGCENDRSGEKPTEFNLTIYHINEIFISKFS